MKGSIRQRSKGSWEIRFELGRDPATGKRMRQIETIKGGKRDAQRRLAELSVENERGSLVKQQKRLTLGQFLMDWCQDLPSRCAPTTEAGYRFILDRYLIPKLGAIPLGQLQPRHIRAYLASIYQAGISGRGLSNLNRLHHYRLLHKTLNDAVRQGYVARNVCDAIDPPPKETKEMSTLAPDDVPKLLAAAQETPFPYYTLFYTMLFTGLRRSEALGLSWGVLDLDLCELWVKQALYRVKGKYVIRPSLKTSKSRRRVDLLPRLSLTLREYRAEVERQRALLGKSLTDDDLVFSHSDGSPLDPGVVTHRFIKTVRRAGLKGIRLHDLRHSYTSLMLAAGVDMKQISANLGHASIGITFDVYGHLLPGAGKAAAQRLEKFLEPWLPTVEMSAKCQQNRMS